MENFHYDDDGAILKKKRTMCFFHVDFGLCIVGVEGFRLQIFFYNEDAKKTGYLGQWVASNLQLESFFQL